MNFITLTVNGVSIAINMDKVLYFSPEQGKGTALVFGLEEGEHLVASETLLEIEQMIHGPKEGNSG